MCLQAFLHFTCSHNTIIIRLCDSGARIADHVPFYMPHSCQSYQVIHNQTSYACGVAPYLDHGNADVRALDSVFLMRQRESVMLAGLESQLAQAVESSTAVKQYLLDAGISEATFHEYPRYREQQAECDFLLRCKQELMFRVGRVADILHHASRCCVLNSNPTAGLVPSTGLLKTRNIPLAESQHDSTLPKDQMHARTAHAVQYEGDHSPPRSLAGKVALNRLHEEPGEQRGPYLSDVNPESQPDSTPKPKRSRRPDQPRRLQVGSGSERSVSVRRSTRVRNKKVNYAESSSSSRSLSPAKSDLSAFSPSRSAMYESWNQWPDSKQQSPPIKAEMSLSNQIKKEKIRELSSPTSQSARVTGSHSNPVRPKTLFQGNVPWMRPGNLAGSSSQLPFTSNMDSHPGLPSEDASAGQDSHFAASDFDDIARLNIYDNRDNNNNGWLSQQQQQAAAHWDTLGVLEQKADIVQGQIAAGPQLPSYHQHPITTHWIPPEIMVQGQVNTRIQSIADQFLPLHHQQSSPPVQIAQQAWRPLAKTRADQVSISQGVSQTQLPINSEQMFSDRMTQARGFGLSIPKISAHASSPTADYPPARQNDPTKRRLPSSSPIPAKRICLRPSVPNPAANVRMFDGTVDVQALVYRGRDRNTTTQQIQVEGDARRVPPPFPPNPIIRDGRASNGLEQYRQQVADLLHQAELSRDTLQQIPSECDTPKAYLPSSPDPNSDTLMISNALRRHSEGTPVFHFTGPNQWRL
nr:hypothetical protein CFP56_52250 [Quercus suber]